MMIIRILRTSGGAQKKRMSWSKKKEKTNSRKGKSNRGGGGGGGSKIDDYDVEKKKKWRVKEENGEEIKMVMILSKRERHNLLGNMQKINYQHTRNNCIITCWKSFK